MNKTKKNSNIYGKLVPIKLIDNKVVKVKQIPGLESKNLKNLEKSTEPTDKPISDPPNNNGIEKLTDELSKKFQKLNEDLKNENEMIGTVEENVGDYPNKDPFGPSSNMHSQSHISQAKKVLFQKSEDNKVVYKVLNSKCFLTIYNKSLPKLQFFKKNEVDQIIKIQNAFKGIYQREVEKGVERLRTSDCILEAMLLLIQRAYDNAKKKMTFKKFKKEFHDPFNNINDELKFEDKIQFKLPNRYYNISDIFQMDSPKNSDGKKKKKCKLIY